MSVKPFYMHYLQFIFCKMCCLPQMQVQRLKADLARSRREVKDLRTKLEIGEEQSNKLHVSVR